MVCRRPILCIYKNNINKTPISDDFVRFANYTGKGVCSSTPASGYMLIICHEAILVNPKQHLPLCKSSFPCF